MISIFYPFIMGIIIGFIHGLSKKVSAILYILFLTMILVLMSFNPEEAVQADQLILRWGFLVEMGITVLGMLSGEQIAKQFKGGEE